MNYRLAEFLIHHSRGQGKTHNLAMLCQKTGSSLIVRNKQEAERIKRAYGIEAYPVDAHVVDYVVDYVNHSGLMYIDPDAAGFWALMLMNELKKEKKRADDAEWRLNDITEYV